jgi:hypothetical protein
MMDMHDYNSGSCPLAHWRDIDIWCEDHLHDVLLFLRLWTPDPSKMENMKLSLNAPAAHVK